MNKYTDAADFIFQSRIQLNILWSDKAQLYTAQLLASQAKSIHMAPRNPRAQKLQYEAMLKASNW